MKTHIAGIPHTKFNLSRLKIDEQVQIVPEPENKFDPNALKIVAQETKLGYIPKDKTAEWKDTTAAKIVEIDADRKWTEVIIETI